MKFNKSYKLILVFLTLSSLVSLLILFSSGSYNISQLNIIEVYAAPTVLGPSSVEVVCPGEVDSIQVKKGENIPEKCQKAADDDEPPPKPTPTPSPTPSPTPDGTGGDNITKGTNGTKTNNPPRIQIANYPKIGKENATITLNAGFTTDPETAKQGLKYQWSQTAGVPIKKFIGGLNSPTLRFALPEVPPAGGSITMQLVVTDPQGQKSVSQPPVFIAIENVNKRPIASVSPITTPKNENTTVTLDASGSKDPDGEPLKFVWRQVTAKPKVTIQNNQSAVASFVAPSVQNDTRMQFLVNVLDGNQVNGKANKTVNVLIKQVNLPPVADAGKDFVAKENSIVTLNGSKTQDPDKLDKLRYLWTKVAGDLRIDIRNEKTLKPSFKVPLVKQNNSLYTFKLAVTDTKGLSSSDTVNMTVRKISNITMNPPTANVIQNMTAIEGTNVTLNAANSTDPDVNEKMSFQWKQIGGHPVVDLRSPNTPKAGFTAPIVEENTTLTFNVTVTNKKGLNDTATTFVKVANLPEPGFPIMYVIIGAIAAGGAAAGVIIYKFFMVRPSGPGRAL